MEERYFKPDDRKPWQKSILLAALVLILFFVVDTLLDIPWKIKSFAQSLFNKSGRKRHSIPERFQTGEEHILSHNTQTYQTTSSSLAGE